MTSANCDSESNSGPESEITEEELDEAIDETIAIHGDVYERLAD